jgi:MFS family permease
LEALESVSPESASGDPASQQTQPKTPIFINRNFALLWSGQAVSYIGDFVFDTTLLLWIATQIGAGQSWAPAAVSGVLACIFAPTLAGAPIAGVFVDRWDKRRTMLAMDAIRACLVAGLILASGVVALPFFAGGSMPAGWQLAMIYTVVLLATVCQQFFGPARMALIGDVVDEEQRARASGLGQVTMSLAAVIGPPLAAPLLFNFGVQWALLFNALSFVVSFFAIALVQAPPAARSVAVGANGHAWQELIDGLRFFAGNQILMTVLISASLAMLGAGALNALDIFFVTGNLHTSASLYGYLSAAFGLGAVVGAILASAYAQRIGPARLFWCALLMTGVGLLIYARLTSFWPAVVLLCVVGIPVAGLNVAVMPLVLQTTPRELIGRVSSVLNPAVSLTSLTSIVVAGMLVSTLLQDFHADVAGIAFGPVDTIFTAGGLLCLAGGLYAMVRFRRVALSAVEAGTAGAGPSDR